MIRMSETPPPLTVATLPAITLLVVVHRTILAALFATRLVGGKSCRANHRRQNRKQNLSIIFHQISFVRDVIRRWRRKFRFSWDCGGAWLCRASISIFLRDWIIA